MADELEDLKIRQLLEPANEGSYPVCRQFACGRPLNSIEALCGHFCLEHIHQRGMKLAARSAQDEAMDIDFEERWSVVDS